MKQRFEQAIQSNEKLSQFQNQIRLAITAEGLQVTVVDEQNRAMFDTGGAALKDYTRDVMRAIGGLLNDVDNAISLAGHTDAVQYAGGERGYSNWELSADRANASRRELVAGGMRETKILRVVGLGSSLPLDVDDPRNPMNRRISLVVLNDKTERQIRGLPEEPSKRFRTSPTLRRCWASAVRRPTRQEARSLRRQRHPSPRRWMPSLRAKRLAQPVPGGTQPESRRTARSSTAASDPVPFAALLVAAERRAVERRAAFGRVPTAPVRDVALVGIVAGQLAKHSPDSAY